MNNKLKIIIIITIIIAHVISCGFIYFWSFLNKIPRQVLPQTDRELGINRSSIRESDGNNTITPKIKGENHEDEPQMTFEEYDKNKDVINIILFGLDRKDRDEAGRADSIILVSVDRKRNKIKITSFMRDMYVPIPEMEDNRINSTYAIGGPALSIKTININFQLDIRDYVSIDFVGLTELIDKVGGVEIDVKSYEIEQCGVSGPGLQNLNGKQTLDYARIRHVGNADYERTERQRNILDKLYKKIKSQGVSKLPGLISSLVPYVETSLSNNEILSLTIEAIKFNKENLEQFRLPVKGTFKNMKIRGMDVLVPDISENQNKLHDFIYEK